MNLIVLLLFNKNFLLFSTYFNYFRYIYVCKYLKTLLRENLGEEHLTDFALLNIHRDIIIRFNKKNY